MSAGETDPDIRRRHALRFPLFRFAFLFPSLLCHLFLFLGIGQLPADTTLVSRPIINFFILVIDRPTCPRNLATLYALVSPRYRYLKPHRSPSHDVSPWDRALRPALRSSLTLSVPVSRIRIKRGPHGPYQPIRFPLARHPSSRHHFSHRLQS